MEKWIEILAEQYGISKNDGHGCRLIGNDGLPGKFEKEDVYTLFGFHHMEKATFELTNKNVFLEGTNNQKLPLFSTSKKQWIIPLAEEDYTENVLGVA